MSGDHDNDWRRSTLNEQAFVEGLLEEGGTRADPVAASLAVAAQIYIQTAAAKGREVTYQEAVDAAVQTYHLALATLESAPLEPGRIAAFAQSKPFSGAFSKKPKTLTEGPAVGHHTTLVEGAGPVTSGGRDGWLATGTKIGGRYTIAGRVGATGSVHVATDEHTRRRVHVQLLGPSFNAAAGATLSTSIAKIRQIRHHGVPTVLEYGVSGPLPWLVLEKREGVGLAALLSSPLRVEDAVSLAASAADAVGALNNAGLVHGDLDHHAFVFVTGAHGAPSLALSHFGLALARGSRPELPANESSPGVAGSRVDVVSPEHVQGQPVDERSDVYSLGVLAYTLLTGSNPFTSPEGMMATCMRQLQHVPPAPHSSRGAVSAGVSAAISRALEKQREARFPTARGFAEALRNA